MDAEIGGASRLFPTKLSDTCAGDSAEDRITYERALVFLLLRLRRLTRFFLHLALILSASWTGYEVSDTN